MTSGVDDLLRTAIELHKAGDLAEALKVYQKIISEMPQHAGALNLLGLAQFQLGKPEEALLSLREAVALRPDLPNVDYNMGHVLFALKRYAQSISHFEKLLALNTTDIEARITLASAQMLEGRNADAATNFAKVLTLQPNYAPAYMGLGNLALGAKEYGKAALHFRSALNVDAKLLTAYFGLAEALRELKDTQEFVHVTARAVALAPNAAEARCWHGLALFGAGRYKEAIEQLRKAIEIRADFAVAHFHLATAHYAINQYEQACEHFQRALALNISSEFANEAEILIAWSLQVFERYDEADQMFDRIIAEHNDNPHGLEAKKAKA